MIENLRALLYLDRQIEPNLTFLNNALAQTGWTKPPLDRASWRTPVRERVRTANWDVIRRDVAGFLSKDDNMKPLNKAVMLAKLAWTLEIPEQQRRWRDAVRRITGGAT